MNLIGRGVTPQRWAHNVNFGRNIWRGRRGTRSISVVPTCSITTTTTTEPVKVTTPASITGRGQWQSSLRSYFCTRIFSSPHKLGAFSPHCSGSPSSPTAFSNRSYSNLSTSVNRSQVYLRPQTPAQQSSTSLSGLSSSSFRYTVLAFPPTSSSRYFSSTSRSSCSAIIPSSIMADRDILPSTVVPSHYDLSIRSIQSKDWSYQGSVK